MGQIARQIFTNNGTFVAPAGVSRIKAIAQPVGWGGMLAAQQTDSTTFIIDNQNNVWAMGKNNSGQAGIASITDISAPTQISGALRFSKLIPFPRGNNFAFYGLDLNGQLYAWGSNVYGQLGNGTITTSSAPALVSAANSSRYKKVFPMQMGGGYGVMALDGYGQAWGWGTNANSWLGTGTDASTVGAYSVPTVVIGGHTFKSLFVHTPSTGTSGGGCFAIDYSGAMWAWGDNTRGVTGTNTQPATLSRLSSPTLVVGGISWATFFPQPTWTNTNAFALDVNNNMWAWGDNSQGQLGVGVNPVVTFGGGFSSPALVVGGIKWQAMATNLLQQSASSNGFTATQVALDVNGNAWTFGTATQGILGNNVDPSLTIAVSSPVQVVGGLKFTKLFTFGNIFYELGQQAWGIDTTGNLWGWGSNTAGFLGIGNLISKSSPVMIAFPGGVGKIQSMFAFAQNNQSPVLGALDDGGNVYMWGCNPNGVIGNNVAPVGVAPAYSSPVQVVGGYKFQQVYFDPNNGSMFGVDINGNIFSWGKNTAGNLGTNDVTARSSPTLVVGRKDVYTAPPQSTQMIDVIPGKSYPITVGGFQAMFGLTSIGALCDQLIIEFEQ
jgi:alpha-tubulin suppressor-like RCC1 family protein